MKKSEGDPAQKGLLNFYLRLDLLIEARVETAVFDILDVINRAPQTCDSITRITPVGMNFRLERPIEETTFEIVRKGTIFAISEQDTDQTNEVLNTLKRELQNPHESLERPVYYTKDLLTMFPDLTKENIYYWENRKHITPQRNPGRKRDFRAYSRVEALRVGLILKYSKRNNLRLQRAVELADEEIKQLLQPNHVLNPENQ